MTQRKPRPKIEKLVPLGERKSMSPERCRWGRASHITGSATGCASCPLVQQCLQSPTEGGTAIREHFIDAARRLAECEADFMIHTDRILDYLDQLEEITGIAPPP